MWLLLLLQLIAGSLLSISLNRETRVLTALLPPLTKPAVRSSSSAHRSRRPNNGILMAVLVQVPAP